MSKFFDLHNLSRGLVSVFGCSHRRGLEAANLDRKIEIFSKPVTRLTELARSRSQDRDIKAKIYRQLSSKASTADRHNHGCLSYNLLNRQRERAFADRGLKLKAHDFLFNNSYPRAIAPSNRTPQQAQAPSLLATQRLSPLAHRLGSFRPRTARRAEFTCSDGGWEE